MCYKKINNTNCLYKRDVVLKKTNDYLSKKISFLSLMSVIAVVFIHAYNHCWMCIHRQNAKKYMPPIEQYYYRRKMIFCKNFNLS